MPHTCVNYAVNVPAYTLYVPLPGWGCAHQLDQDDAPTSCTPAARCITVVPRSTYARTLPAVAGRFCDKAVRRRFPGSADTPARPPTVALHAGCC